MSHEPRKKTCVERSNERCGDTRQDETIVTSDEATEQCQRSHEQHDPRWIDEGEVLIRDHAGSEMQRRGEVDAGVVEGNELGNGELPEVRSESGDADDQRNQEI